MIFGRGRYDDDDDEDEDEEDIDFVLFQGALNGNNPDLGAHGKLVQAGLLPAKRLISEALSRRSEMIRIDFKGKAAASTMFVDGVPYSPSRMPPNMALAITQILKLLAGLDIRVKDKPQQGGIKAEYDGTPYEIRINTQPVKGGPERLIIRAYDSRVKLDTPKDLGFSESLVDKIRDVSSSSEGMIVVSGPPFSGVTTSMIATVRATDAYMYSIYCLTSLEGRDVPHVRMFPPNPGDDLERTMTRAKREDADVMVVDPLDNVQTIKLALEFSDRAAIVAEMPARDAADALAKLVQVSGDPNLVAERMRLVLSQMLIRLLCKECRLAYRPHPKLLSRLGLPPETKVLYRPYEPDEEEEEEEPCERCGGTGYYGRTGLMEVIEMTDGMKEVIRQGGDAKAIRAQARTEKMQTFQSDGLRVVIDGKTSLEELQRAFKAQSSGK